MCVSAQWSESCDFIRLQWNATCQLITFRQFRLSSRRVKLQNVAFAA